MAASEENDLIGYDPLMWMEGDADENEEHLVTDESHSDNELEGQQLLDHEIGMVDDFIENAEENSILQATIEDQLVIDEIEGESDSALIEETAAGDSDLEAIEESQIDLDATLTIQNVGKLHEKLKNLLAVHDQIEINASDVSSIDTATLQLLVSLKKDEVKLQKKVTIIYPSPRFVESAQLLGLSDVLGVHDV